MQRRATRATARLEPHARPLTTPRRRQARPHLWRALAAALPGDGAGWTLLSTGHSLGGALATLLAADAAVRRPAASVVMYNFGSPKVPPAPPSYTPPARPALAQILCL
jgi:predicted alpha/beta-hydrolase family hydrolase